MKNPLFLLGCMVVLLLFWIAINLQTVPGRYQMIGRVDNMAGLPIIGKLDTKTGIIEAMIFDPRHRKFKTLEEFAREE